MDALQAFLSADLDVKKAVHIKRLGIDLEIKPITSKFLGEATEQASVGADVDNMLLNCVLVAGSCTNVNFGDTKMLEKYKASDSADCVGKALLPGELAKVTQEIMAISGFDLEAEVKAAKN